MVTPAAANERPSGQILKGLLDSLVLRILADGDNYGFGILARLAELLDGDDTLLRDATLYPLLHRLEERGSVESYYQPGQRGTPRRYYRLTGEGRLLLSDRIAEWEHVAVILRKTMFRS